MRAPRTRLRRLTLGLLAAAPLLAGCTSPGSLSSTEAHVPRTFIGIDASDLYGGQPGGTTPGGFGAVARAHIGVVRQFADFQAMEPAPGTYDFADFDRFVGAAARRHVTVLAALLGCPPWALPVGAHPSTQSPYFPPRDNAALASFATQLVRRYGPRGTFWRQSPGLPRTPIRSWQVWNEPNLPRFWGGRPRPREYVAMLRTVGRAIHRADPGATVISAGIPQSKQGIRFGNWINRFFRQGGRGTFDAFGVHSYGANVEAVLQSVDLARALMRRWGAGRVPIWVTEFGWADRGPISPFTVSSRTQAFNVGSALERLAAARSSLGLRGVVYFEWRDFAPVSNHTKGWGSFTGLHSYDGRPKPALRAFTRATRRLER